VVGIPPNLNVARISYKQKGIYRQKRCRADYLYWKSDCDFLSRLRRATAGVAVAASDPGQRHFHGEYSEGGEAGA
jgi:hypothetical protein